MKKLNQFSFLCIAIFLCVFIALLSICFGSARLSLSQIWEALWYRAEGGFAQTIFWYVRLPRTLGCLLAGAGLAVSGAVIQGVLANKLASPSIIGVNAGAGLAVTICCACGLLTGWAITLASFLGAMFAVMIVVIVARKVSASRTTVILIGVAMNSFLNAGSEAITTLIPEVSMMNTDFRVGGFSAVSYVRLLPAGVVIIISFLIILSLCNELDIMTLGEETAQGLGLPVKWMRTVFLTLSALLAGASVSFAGLLGFVGLVVPHAIRKITGSESKKLLPFCAVCGATFVTFCDLCSRLLFAPYEVPVGILLSFFGAPFFLWLLLRKKGGHMGD